MEKFSSNKKEAVKLIRQKIGSKILGISTHNLEEIKEANELDINYIGLGAYRATTTKENASIKGKELLNIAKESTHPVALIGGVRIEDDFSNYPQIAYRVIGSDLVKYYLNRK